MPGADVMRASHCTPQLSTLPGLMSVRHGRGRCKRRGSWGNNSIGANARPPTPPEAHDALRSTCSTSANTLPPSAPRAGIAALIRPWAFGLHHGVSLRYLAIPANVLWCLGYPASRAAESGGVALAQEIAHPIVSRSPSSGRPIYMAAAAKRSATLNETLLTWRPRGVCALVGIGTYCQGWALAYGPQAYGADAPGRPPSWRQGGRWGALWLVLLAEPRAAAKHAPPGGPGGV
jgi:hypothetical protein